MLTKQNKLETYEHRNNLECSLDFDFLAFANGDYNARGTQLAEIPQVNTAAKVVWGFPSQSLQRAVTKAGLHMQCSLLLFLF
jgi:hypothetical protein